MRRCTRPSSINSVANLAAELRVAVVLVRISTVDKLATSLNYIDSFLSRHHRIYPQMRNGVRIIGNAMNQSRGIRFGQPNFGQVESNYT